MNNISKWKIITFLFIFYIINKTFNFVKFHKFGNHEFKCNLFIVNNEIVLLLHNIYAKNINNWIYSIKNNSKIPFYLLYIINDIKT